MVHILVEQAALLHLHYQQPLIQEPQLPLAAATVEEIATVQEPLEVPVVVVILVVLMLVDLQLTQLGPDVTMHMQAADHQYLEVEVVGYTAMTMMVLVVQVVPVFGVVEVAEHLLLEQEVLIMAARFPETLALLEADLADVDGGGSMHGRFVLLPFGATAPRVGDELAPREAELLRLVRPGPQPLRALATSPNAQRAITALQRKGLVQVAGFTPSDAGHVLDLQANWSRPAAYMAAQLGCRLREMKMPTPERTRDYAHAVWSETVRLSARVILDTALGFSLPEDRISNAICNGEQTLGLARISIKPSVPVVAVGGPVKVFYGELARRLDCEVVFPPHCDVANAVGAATGVVAYTATAEVHGDGSGMFRATGAALTQTFTNAEQALAAASAAVQQAALQAVQSMGAAHPEVELSVRKTHYPNAVDDRGLMEAVLTARAIGRP